MPAKMYLKNAKVEFVKRRKNVLSARVTTWNKKGKDDFEKVNLSLVVFDRDNEVSLDKGDKVNVKGTFRLDSNPKVKQVHQESGKEYDSSFPEVIAFPDGIEVVEKGDRTSKSQDAQAREAEREVQYPENDHDDFPWS